MKQFTVRTETAEEFHKISDLVRYSFKHGTTYSDGTAEENLVTEIRSKKWYNKDMTFVCIEEDEIVGYVMLSDFEVKGAEKVLLMSPVAVDYTRLGKGIGTYLIKKVLKNAADAGYNAVIVEGNPDYYHRFGFATSTKFGISPSENLTLPLPECLMVKELKKGSLADVKTEIDFSMYDYA